MANINLLPKDRASNKELGRLYLFFKKLSFLFFVLFLIVTGVGGAIYFLFNNDLNNTKTKYEEASSKYKSLQSTEASLIFLKDRLQKSQEIFAGRKLEESFDKQQRIFFYAPEDVGFVKSKSDYSSSELELEFSESRSVKFLLENLAQNSDFNRLVIKELTFLQNKGYNLLLGGF